MSTKPNPEPESPTISCTRFESASAGTPGGQPTAAPMHAPALGSAAGRMPVPTRPWILALALAVSLALPASGGATQWPVAPEPGEDDIPGVQRDGTLRIVRFTGSWGEVPEDQGTLIGWAGAAATGDLVLHRDDEAEVEATIEILRPAQMAPAGEEELSGD